MTDHGIVKSHTAAESDDLNGNVRPFVPRARQGKQTVKDSDLRNLTNHRNVHSPLGDDDDPGPNAA